MYFYWKHESISKRERVPSTLAVGWIGPLSGSAGALGVDSLNAVKLALQEYQAKKSLADPEISLLDEDDNYNIAITLLKYNQMMANTPKPVAIMVGTYSGLIAIAPLVLKDSVIALNPIDNDKEIASLNRNVFLIAKETEPLAGLVVNAIIDQGKKNIAVIYYGDDDFMKHLATLFREILVSNNSQAQMFSYNRETTDFHSFLEKAKASNVDGYVFFGYQEIGLAMKQARDMGILAPFYSVNVIADPVLQKNSEGAINGTYFAHFTSLDGNRVEADEFLNKYYRIFKRKPLLEWTAMQSYDAARILFVAIQDAYHESGDFTDNLRKKLLETSNFEGVSGNISILPSGASRGIYTRLYILQDGEAVPAE